MTVLASACMVALLALAATGWAWWSRGGTIEVSCAVPAIELRLDGRPLPLGDGRAGAR